jgi:hypothetical protein
MELSNKIKSERLIIKALDRQIAYLQSKRSYRKQKLKKLLEITDNQLSLEL